jgi:hypothetical protein
MAIKVEVEEQQENNEIDYPFIGISKINGTIILFFKPKEGIVLQGKKEEVYRTSCYDINWNMANFKPFKGKITLSNE